MSEEQGKPDIDSLLRNAQPRWITDGAGIRGNPVPTPPPSTGWDPSRSSGMSPVDPPVADYSGGVSTSNPASSPVSVTQTASTPRKALEIIMTSEDSGGVTHDYLSLYPGTVGGIYPKVDSKFLWMRPSNGSGGFLEYPRMSITLPAAAGDPPLFVWLKAKCLTGVVVEVTCETGTTVPDNTVEYGYVRLGYINSDGTVYQEAYGPISYFLAFALDPNNPIGHEFVAR